MAGTGQTINDRLNAVRYALVGQGLARTVCKATTLEVVGPKKKHIDYLLACTNEPNVSIPQLANLLIERTQHTCWAVVFKSLITIHHLMSYGNERFSQYLATSNHSFDLGEFMDRTTPQGYNMSTFVRQYAKYINNKSLSYRTLAIDLCKIRSGNDNALRTMNMDNLSKTLPIVQAQFDSLLDFAVSAKDLNNGVITSAFRLLYKDLVKLYVAYQEAIINLLERYFKLSRKKTREALELYKKYLARMDKVVDFLRVVEAVGLDKSEMPDLTKSPASILNLLEQHLAQLEAKKRGTTQASPEVQAEDEDEGETNKENEGQQTKVEISEAVPTAEEKKFEATVEQSCKAGTSTTSNEVKKQMPPQKPARPSPKASPAVSPSSEPKQAPDSKSAPPAERKAPPERPVKPPSRPPPPSGAPAVPAQPVTSSTIGAQPDQAQVASSSANQHQAKPVSPVPPPHPPPPHPHPPAAASSSAPVPAQATTTAAPQSPPEANHTDKGAGELETNNTNHEEEEVSTSTCSAVISNVETNNRNNAETLDSNDNNSSTINDATNHDETESTNQRLEVEANHVNNSQQEDAEEVEMPPPPPPIEDIDEQPVEPDAVNVLQGLEINGQSESDHHE